MSLFGESPPSHAADKSRGGLFDDTNPPRSSSTGLFDNNDDSEDGHSDQASDTNSLFASPRGSKKGHSRSKSRAETIRSMLASSLADLPEEYGEFWTDALRDEAEREGGDVTMISEELVDQALDDAMIKGPDREAIREIVIPYNGDGLVGRGEFSLLLALIGLVQDEDEPTLDAVNRRRRNLPIPRFLDPILKNSRDELAAKPPQNPVTTAASHIQSDASSRSAASDSDRDSVSDAGDRSGVRPLLYPGTESHTHSHVESDDDHSDADNSEDNEDQDDIIANTQSISSPQIAYPETDDPWGSPEVHKGHDHVQSAAGLMDSSHHSSGTMSPDAVLVSHSASPVNVPIMTPPTDPPSTTSNAAGSSYQPASPRSTNAIRHGSIGNPVTSAPWSYYDNGGFGEPVNPFGGPSPTFRNPVGGLDGLGGASNGGTVPTSSTKPRAPEETVLVTLLPEKEGMFMFQHHNYEVTSSRRGSKVIRRYSDFVWLLDCLHKRYPFRALPMLPPKRVALNGNHLSNDGAFIEKRRRGLARFLNAIVRHPVFAAEQLVIMFLTVPTELSVWRRQATISVQDEFAGRALAPGLEDSLPSGPLEDLFSRNRSGIRRSADLYIGVCNIMDRLVKRTEGVAADHARIALSLISLTESNGDVYATDPSDVPALNTGLQSMSRHLRTAQSLLEDESRAWESGVLEDLKRQRDALVALRDMFERRDALDRDNIPALEKRIATNEQKIATLRSKPAAMVKAGEIEKLCESVGIDKAEIIRQRNRRIFVRECLRDELKYAMSSVGMVTRWCQEWAQERVKYAEMMADNWRSLIDGLEIMPVGE